MIKYLKLLLILNITLAQKIIIPMDKIQNDHLKAYGIAYFSISKGHNVEWLLNYRGGSFLIDGFQSIKSECKIRGVTFEIINSKKFGIEGGNIAIGKLSGRAGVQKVLDDLNINIEPDRINEFLAFIKNKSVDLKEINNSIMKSLVKEFNNK